MRTVLASAQSDLRLSLQILLREEPGIEIVGMATEAASVRSLLHSSLPDLFILDWALPGSPPDQWLIDARQIRSHPMIIVIGCDEGMRQEAMAAGADAFVGCGDIPSDMIPAIREDRTPCEAGT